ncbi:hypothetical protein, partial [Streptosporangium album]|uniref:hypothetical protein n=1 Tax=Streptosporangium album TaxID=47479 RepID=UPI0031E9B1B3
CGGSFDKTHPYQGLHAFLYLITPTPAVIGYTRSSTVADNVSLRLSFSNGAYAEEKISIGLSRTGRPAPPMLCLDQSRVRRERVLLV